MFSFRLIAAIVVLAETVLAGCALSGGVMDTGNGTYMISAYASPVRGGVTGANKKAYGDANQFCNRKSGAHAVMLNVDEHDLNRSGFGGTSGPDGGSFYGHSTHAGRSDMQFRCEL